MVDISNIVTWTRPITLTTSITNVYTKGYVNSLAISSRDINVIAIEIGFVNVGVDCTAQEKVYM